MLVTQFETLQEPGADETDVLWWISINRWKVLWQAPLRLLKRQISSDYINACFNSSRVCFMLLFLVMKARMHAFLALMVVPWGLAFFPVCRSIKSQRRWKRDGRHPRLPGGGCRPGSYVCKILHETGAVDQIAVKMLKSSVTAARIMPSALRGWSVRYRVL